MTTTLTLGPGLKLPLDIVTEATAIVATRGAGKSSASAVLIEEAFAAGVQTVTFDRTGVYWGLRSNSKGDGPGLAIYVLGGPHGDVPLEATAGKLIADLAVAPPRSSESDIPRLARSGLDLISIHYGVPAKRGRRVRLGLGFGQRAGQEGVITQSVSGAMQLHVRLDGDKHSGVYHPTWELEYLDA